MGVENLKQKTIEQEVARFWGEMQEFLPEILTDKEKIWLKRYLKAQVALSEKDSTEAYKQFDMLDESKGYISFEDNNPHLFSAIDHAVRGKTNRKDQRGNSAAPLFLLKHS